MTLDSESITAPPRWLHGLAVLTVLLTLPLLFLGAGVTSHGVGMVDPHGYQHPWKIVQGLLENSGLDWRLEYGHRTFGFLVGLCGILLAVGCWFFDPRPGMCWLGIAALALICAQGALGIFRVDYDTLHGRTFALIHGCFAQLVFAALVSVALFTSRSWTAEHAEPVSPALQRWSIITVVLVFVQLVLGGLIRHNESLLGPRGHLLGAFVVVGSVLWLLHLIRASSPRPLREGLGVRAADFSPRPLGEGSGVRAADFSPRPLGEGLGVRASPFRTQRILLMTLLTVQLLLGVESWLLKFFAPGANLPQLQPLPMHGEWIRTAHYLAGTLIFSTTVVVALIAHRKLLLTTETLNVRPRTLEGAL